MQPAVFTSSLRVLLVSDSSDASGHDVDSASSDPLPKITGHQATEKGIEEKQVDEFNLEPIRMAMAIFRRAVEYYRGLKLDQERSWKRRFILFS